MSLNGVINVLKPPGMTSSNVVVHLKHLLNTRKVGHCGTLDPGAAGVLTVCVGCATKISDYLMNSEKEYISEFVFGYETDTLDSYGTVTDIASSFVLDLDRLDTVLKGFIGNIIQIPPKYSAIKINGLPLYRYAKKNINTEIVIPERNIYISDIIVLNCKDNRVLLKIKCSKGTYIRSLCSDIAHSMDTVGYVSFLLRTYACGTFIDNTYSINELEKSVSIGDYSFINSIENVLDNINRVFFDDYLFKILITGSPIDITRIRNAYDLDYNGPNMVFCKKHLIGIGFIKNNFLKIKTMLYQQGEML